MPLKYKLGADGNGMQERKPRAIGIGIDPRILPGLGGLRISGDGSIDLLDMHGVEMPQALGGTSLAYPRSKGPKITVQLFDPPGTHSTVAAAIPKFSRVFAVDTNTRASVRGTISVCAVSTIRDFQLAGSKWSCNFEPIWAAELHDVRGDAERVGWYEALVHLSARSQLDHALLVVDAYLGDLPRIARREIPLLGDCLLPDKVWLAYASSDSPHESPLNGLIRVSDQAATRVLQHVAGQDDIEPPLAIVSDDAPFRAFRYWKLTI